MISFFSISVMRILVSIWASLGFLREGHVSEDEDEEADAEDLELESSHQEFPFCVLDAPAPKRQKATYQRSLVPTVGQKVRRHPQPSVLIFIGKSSSLANNQVLLACQGSYRFCKPRMPSYLAQSKSFSLFSKIAPCSVELSLGTRSLP